MIFRKSLGVFIDDEKLQLCLLSKELKRTRLVDLLTIPEIRLEDLGRHRQLVSEFLKKNKVSHYVGTLLVSRQGVIIRQLELPKEAESNIEKVVQYHAAGLVPSDDAAYCYDFHVSRENGQSKTLNVTIYLVARAYLDQSLKICEELGIRLNRVVPTSVALGTYFLLMNPKGRLSSALLAYTSGNQCELVSIVNQGIRSAKVFRSAGSDPLSRSMTEEIELFRGQLRLPEEQSLDLYYAGRGWQPSSDEGVRVRPHDLVQSAPPDVGYGPFAADMGRVEAHFLPLCAAHLGLRFNLPIQLNLLPKEKRVHHSKWIWVPTFALAAISVILLLALFVSGPLLDRRYALDLEREVHRLEPEVKNIRTVEGQISDLQRRSRTLLGLKEGHHQFLLALNELSIILPKNTFLFDLTLKNQVIEVYGASDAAAALPKILDNSPYFKETEFVGGISRDGSGREIFRIRTKLEFSPQTGDAAKNLAEVKK